MVTIYPNKVKHTTKDEVLSETCCQGRGYGTQKLYNDSNILKKGSYASWGEDTTNASGPSGNSPKAIATPSGTRRQPEEIILTSWDVSSIPKGAIINSVTIEVSYFTQGYKNYSYVPGSFPDQTVIKLMDSNGKKIDTGKIKGPTKNETERTVTFSSLKLTPSELKKSQVSIKIGENTKTGVVCKVKIKYLRMQVSYIDPVPKYKLSLTTNKTWVKKNESYTYTAKIKNNNSYDKQAVLYVTIPNDTTVTGLTHYKNNVYQKKINGDTNVSFTLTHQTLGSKKVSATLSQYSNDKPSKTITVKQSNSKLTLEPIIYKHNGEKVSGNKIYEEEGKVQFKITVEHDIALSKNKIDTTIINTAGLITTWDAGGTHKGNGIWEFKTTSNGSTKKIEKITPYVDLNTAGTFNIKVTNKDNETNSEKTQTSTIQVLSRPFQKEYFKIKLEDGTDVQYNSLSFSQGDDLKNPLTYTTEDYTPIQPDDFTIIGETKRIPVEEAEYLSFEIKLNKEKTELNNVLAYIEAITEDGKDCSDIIVGIDNNGILFEGNDNKYCLIKELSSSNPTTLKLIVQSEIEQNCIIKIRPYNYDLYDTGKWTSGKVVFKDMPNVKMHIEGKDNDVSSGENIIITYCIENKSDVIGKKLKYKIKEPYGFKAVSTINNVEYDYGKGISFNESSRIWEFETMPAHSQEYVLQIKYEAIKKGIHNFILETLDNKNTTEDDQHKNSCRYQVMVDIISEVDIHTSVNHNQPERNQLIDYVITVTNRLKHQNEFSFDIVDIGDFSPTHNKCHYTIQHVKIDKGEFKDSKELGKNDNTIGQWKITDIPVNATYKLILSLRPVQIGLHSIKTVFTDTQNNEQIFTNRVKVLENKKQLSFNVYHAVNDDDIDCKEINDDNLTIICDDDYINLSDSIYYIIEIINNNRLELSQPINIYARLPESFLENEYCSVPNDFVKDENSNLLNYQIQSIPGCGKTRVYLKVKPSENGSFTSNFMLSTKTSDVLHKSLHLTVDTEFNQRELEHEIKIYNFDKTNKYYRYEIDGQGEIFKFYNTGDKTVRPIETESYNVSSVETYTGTNLKEIVRDIKKNSKYVDPIYLREGNNKLKDKGYELYPDGLIRRFGLLKSEVFHYTNQLPVTSDLIEKTMRWNIDEWNTKIWAGGDYDNGVFDLTVDYDKIPSNFDIPSATSLVKNLQAITDKTKPYGTKGKCYCSAVAEVGFGISIDNVYAQIQHNIDLSFNIDDIFLLTTYNRSDNSLAYFNDAISYNIQLALDKISTEYENISQEEDKLSTGFDAGVTNVCVYESSMKKEYINDITDILDNLYNYNNNTNNIDITIPYQNFDVSDTEPYDIKGYQTFHYVNKHTDQLTGLSITNKDINIEFGYIEEKDFQGFILKSNDIIANKRIIHQNVNTFNVMSQTITDDGDTTVHFWASINENNYVHIGFINLTKQKTQTYNNQGNLRATANDTVTPIIAFLNNDDGLATYSQSNDNIPITFQVSDKVKKQTKHHNNIIQKDSKKWYDLDKINNGGYAFIDYNSKIDKECSDETIRVPKIITKYDDMPLSRLDEVEDIEFKITAQSNKENFADDININLLRDGDYYYPSNNVSRKIYYPTGISNIEHQMLTRYIIEQPNITICGDCLQTTLGYVDKCEHCGSTNISQYNKVQPVTVCDACGWVTDGTHTYCHHCLSKDVENVDVDYNKTYCYNCDKLSDDYYQYCPYCFSPDTVYLDNKKTAYTLEKNNQNINPIIIKTQEVENDVNICNIDIPFGKNSDIIKELSSLTLHIECTNNNNGTYYYCPDCQVGGLGNHITCPNCNSSNIVNKQTQGQTFECYLNNNAKISKIPISENDLLEQNKFTKTIDLLSIVDKIERNNFTLQLYVNNPSLSDNIQSILSLDIEDKYKQTILDNINNFNFTIDNIYTEYEYINSANVWSKLSSIQGSEHTGIKYNFNNETESEDLIFNFKGDTGNNIHGYFYIAGICKSTGNYAINLKITDINNQVHTKSIKGINNILFNEEIDLADISSTNLKDFKVAVSFEGDINDVIITDCNVLIEKDSNELIDKLMTDAHIDYKIDGDDIILTSDNMWGLNNIDPYYVLSGRALESNLLGYINFGELQSSEYIRLYDIDMIIYYKSKVGKITTKSIPIYDESLIEQFISGEINNKGGEFWGFITQDEEFLNNLEYEKVHVDEEGNLSNSLPLNKKISQSFVSTTNEISKISIEYFGKKGYPSDIIDVFLYDDYNNAPNNLVAQNQVIMPNKKEVINIDFDINELNIGEKYWIIIKDDNADENNYHRFNYNNNNIGTLIIGKKATTSQSLCFSVDYPNKMGYYKMPVMWTINSEKYTIELNKAIETSFIYDEEMESLAIKVLSVNGNPAAEIKYEIYDDTKTKILPDNIITLPRYRSNVHIDISALEKNKEYYIKLIPTQIDDKNYFILSYDDTNNTFIANMDMDTEYDTSTSNDIEKEELKQLEDSNIDYKMANVLYRYNIKESNVCLSKVIIRNGYNIEC